MGCQLSDADIQNTSFILSRVKKVIAQDEYDQLEATLANTNQFSKETEKQGHDALWGFCVKAIGQVFLEGNYREARILIEASLKYEGISREEIDDLKRLNDKIDEITDQDDPTQLAIMSAEFLVLIGNRERAIECLLEQKNQKRLTKKNKATVLFKLNQLYDHYSDFDRARLNILELIKLKPHSIEVFTMVLDSNFMYREDFQTIAIDYLRNNVENLTLWEQLVNYYGWDFVARIHKELNYPFIPLKTVLIDILDAYSYIKDRESWSILASKIKENSFWDEDFDYKFAALCYSDNDLKSAERTLKGLILKDETNSKYLSLYGAVLRQQEKFSEAIRVFKRIDISSLRRDTITEQMFECYAADGKDVKAKKLFDERYNSGIPQNAFRSIYNLTGRDNIADNLLFKCLENKSVIPRQRKEYWRDFDYFFRQIFDDSRDIEGNGELKVKLLELHKNITLLKKKLQLDYSKNEFIYHYSSIASIIPLTGFKEDKPSRFQVSNVSFMNDPGEGQAFTKILEEFADKKSINNIMDKLYGEDNITYRKTYLSSFTLRRDFLPMWIQYAEGGTGCCYKLLSDEFGIRDSSLEKQVTKFKRKSEKSERDYPVLYEVFYYDKDKKDDPKIESCKKIAEILLALSKFLKHNRVQTIVSGMLDEIRYLIKSSDYQTEAEVRIVCTDFEQEAMRRMSNRSDVPPKMYLELSVDWDVRELMLGPRVVNAKEWAAYLGNCSNVKQVSVSKIQYK